MNICQDTVDLRASNIILPDKSLESKEEQFMENILAEKKQDPLNLGQDTFKPPASNISVSNKSIDSKEKKIFQEESKAMLKPTEYKTS